MVCKEDVVTWFKELTSYNRIDVMCTLQNMCLPLELRFLGTCLEDLGKRDFLDLRDAENRANNSTELSDFQCLSDKRTQRKLSLYLSLLRSCNYACSNGLYKVLANFNFAGINAIISNSPDENPFEELLLVYTLALNHPAFTYEQKSVVGNILLKLQDEENKMYSAKHSLDIDLVYTIKSPMQENLKDRDISLLVAVDGNISIQEERFCQNGQEDCQVKEPSKSQPREVVWTDGPATKTEPMEETTEADPLFMDGLDQPTSIKWETVCKAQQEDCHDPELFVPGSTARSLCNWELREGFGTNVGSVGEAAKQEPMACVSVYMKEELVSDEASGGCDESYWNNHNSSQPPHDCHLGDLGPGNPELNGSTMTTWDRVQGRDCWVTTPGPGNVSFTDGAICDKSLQCDWCKRLFRLKGTLRAHIAAHTRNKPHHCEICKKQFRDFSSLTIHSRIHSGLKPYQCEVCKKQFTQSGHLSTHSVIHSGLKPFPCRVCGKAFRRSHHLVTHGRIHSGLKPYRCEICGKQFSSKANFSTHGMTHTGFKPHTCPDCGRHFSKKSNLASHSRVHSGLKPYRCELCPKQFSHNTSLTLHSRKHTGFKPYKCQVCAKQFIDSSSLSKHGRTHNELKL